MTLETAYDALRHRASWDQDRAPENAEAAVLDADRWLVTMAASLKLTAAAKARLSSSRAALITLTANQLPELSEAEEKHSAFIERMNDFDRGSADEVHHCPHCLKVATGAHQIGRSVYVAPCNCRVGQGRVPKWAMPAPARRNGKAK